MMDEKTNKNKAQDSTHLHSSIRTSLYAPLDIVPLLPPLIFSIFWAIVVFWENLTFCFYNFLFFLDLGAHKK